MDEILNEVLNPVASVASAAMAVYNATKCNYEGTALNLGLCAGLILLNRPHYGSKEK